MATVQKRGKSYRIRVSDGYTAAGKQVTRSMTWTPAPGMTERQVQKELQRQVVQFEASAAAVSASVKFEVFAKQWFEEYAATNLRPRSLERYQDYEQRTYKAIGHLSLDKIGVRTIQKFINSLSQPGTNQRSGAGLSVKTQRGYLSFISSVFSYAAQIGVIRDNPAQYVKLPKRTASEKKIYTVEQVQTILEHLPAAPLWFQVFLLLAIYGGPRKEEILGFEWDDFDAESGLVSICRASLYSKQLGTYTDTTKTAGSTRIIKYPAFIFDYVRRLKVEQNAQRLRLGDRWHDTERLFTTWDGRPMSTNTPYKALQRFCEQHDLPNLGIHSFRHLNASLLIAGGVDVRTVSAALGHTQTSTTLNIYAHAFAEAQAKASQVVADALPFSPPQQKAKA